MKGKQGMLKMTIQHWYLTIF